MSGEGSDFRFSRSLAPTKSPPGTRYNADAIMQSPRYALVAYVRNPVGEFVEGLRRELHPQLPHLAAHLTVLPPRILQGSEASAIERLEEVCSHVNRFEVSLGDVETFVPVTPTVFIRVAYAAYRMRELHDQLNASVLSSQEEWPYMPHLTVVKMATEEEANHAFQIARQRWAQFQGPRRIPVEELTFVREDRSNSWVDLAPLPLGRALATRR